VFKHLLDGVWSGGAVTANVAFARFYIKFNVGYACPVLPAVVLLFHKQVKLIEAVKRCAVFFLIKLERF